MREASGRAGAARWEARALAERDGLEGLLLGWGAMRMAHTQHTLEHTTQEMVHGLVRERVLCCGGGVVGGRLGLVSRWFGQLYAALLRLRAGAREISDAGDHNADDGRVIRAH